MTNADTVQCNLLIINLERNSSIEYVMIFNKLIILSMALKTANSKLIQTFNQFS